MYTHTGMHRRSYGFALIQHLLLRVLTTGNHGPHFAEGGHPGTGGLNDLLLVLGRVLAPGPAFPGVLLSSLLSSSWPSQGPGARTWEQGRPRGEEAKPRTQHLRPGHRTKDTDLELKIQVPKGSPFLNQLNSSIDAAWSGAQEGRGETEPDGTRGLAPAHSASMCRHPPPRPALGLL